MAVRLNVIDLGASRWRCVVFDDAGFAWSRTVSGTLVEGQAYGQGPVSAPGAEVVLRCVGGELVAEVLANHGGRSQIVRSSAAAWEFRLVEVSADTDADPRTSEPPRPDGRGF